MPPFGHFLLIRFGKIAGTAALREESPLAAAG